MIELKNISKTFERNNTLIPALQGVNLKIDEGDIYGVIGYSGAGKSTLIRLINHLEQPTEGQVLIAGQPLEGYNTAELRAVKKKIGMIFQHFNLLESKTVYDNIALPLVLLKRKNFGSFKKKKSEIHQRVLQLLEFIGLTDKANSYPKELSGGQKQRVGIARALANNPSILLCDEATSALDPQTTLSILKLLKKINQEYNITIVIITHEMSVIQEICDKVAVMEQGKVIEQGSVLSVFGHPQQLTTQSFVRTVINDSVPKGILSELNKIQGRRLFKLEFLAQSASEPVINQLILEDKVVVNILFAHMSEVQNTILGSMFIQLSGSEQEINEAIDFLHQRGVQVTEVEKQ